MAQVSACLMAQVSAHPENTKKLRGSSPAVVTSEVITVQKLSVTDKQNPAFVLVWFLNCGNFTP